MSVDPDWITAGAAVVGVIAGNAILYHLQNKQHKFASLNKVFEMMRSTADERRMVYEARKKYRETGDMEMYLRLPEIEKVRTTIDMIGVLYDKGSLPKDEVLEMYWQSFINSWINLQPLIKQKRTTHGKAYSKYFEKLYEEALKHQKNNYPDTLTEAQKENQEKINT